MGTLSSGKTPCMEMNKGMNLIQMKITEYESRKCTKIDGPQSFILSSLVKGFAYFKNSLYTFEQTWKSSTTISRL
jgi:hypothetical protein